LENLRLNRADNVRPVNVAVAARAGTIALFRGPGRNAGMTTVVASRGFEAAGEVPARPLFDILTEPECARLRLIKLDVEGAEGAVLADIAGRIGRLPRSLEIVAEISGKQDPEVDAAFARFMEAGYALYEIPNSYNPRTYLKYTGPQAPVPLRLPFSVQKDVLISRDPR
jgi:FkbM family methyltransferase